MREIALPDLGTVSAVRGRHDQRDIFLACSSFLAPTQVLRHELPTGKTAVWQKLRSPVDPSPFTVEQVHYSSKDGTRIPMFLVHRRDLRRDGRNPTLLYGYGGFNVSLTPAFAAWVGPFLERGGVYAVANLRGGGEYGEAWHRAGMLGRKQNVFDDFAAAAEYLLAERITTRERFAIAGRSNGGLLVAASIVQHPGLFRAAVVGVPLADMVRYHRLQLARLWIPEYGSPEDRRGVRLAFRLFALPPRRRRRRLPGHSDPLGRVRHTGRPHARAQARRAPASRDLEQAAHPAAHGEPGRPRRRQAHGQAHRPVHRRVRFSLLGARPLRSASLNHRPLAKEPVNVKKTRVIILFGGRSAEHEVSLLSARNVFLALDRERFEPVLVGIDKQGHWRIEPERTLLDATGDPRLLKLVAAGHELAVPVHPDSPSLGKRTTAVPS